MKRVQGERLWPKLLVDTGRKKARGAHLSIEKILEWADAHYDRTGKWPTEASGAVTDAPGETWRRISKALSDGRAVFPGDRLCPGSWWKPGGSKI